jgi:phage/plasmid-like protein (TIGR03299 family)
MAALIETMAYVGQEPWHHLGNKVEEGTPLEEFQKQAGLDWTVSKRPVEYLTTSVNNSPSRTFPKRFVIARDTDDRPYSVVSDRYKPVQPKEVFEFFRDLLSMHNMKMHTAGSLSDGQRIWCLAETGDAHKVRGSDEIEGYLLLSTSYDLTLSTLAQFTSVRVVCNNTLQQALENNAGRITIPHVQDFDADKIKGQLGIGREQWAAFTGVIDLLARTKLDAAKASDVVNKVFKMPEEMDKRTLDPDRIHVANIIQMFKSESFIGADLTREGADQTAWGLMNCVTEYVDFRKRARNQGNRLNSAWFGDGAGYKAATLSELQLLAA